ncbi:hypothetical protein HH007_04720 [Treponema denticola]|uniref:hypothetical protein n=1 Tax=Treponema TaxID=157 RepID=UPI00040D1005|nr:MULTISPECIES: hypothetical protein [Treponema]UTC83681.1 hypothetical protein HGJ18_10875 [Treponema denticola]
MKKKIVLTVIFICSVFTAVYAQQIDFKYYNDLSENSGYAVALYIPPNKESTVFDNFSKEPGRDLTKLSKSNVWLCWQALNEYDISDGESYIVLICKSLFSPESIALYVTITNNGTSFKYWGKVLKNDKL